MNIAEFILMVAGALIWTGVAFAALAWWVAKSLGDDE